MVEALTIWLNDPVQFVRDNFHVEPDEWQKEFLYAYNNNSRVAAKACKGPGKSAVLAWCSWHFLATRPFPKMAATSITGDNLRDNLWAEMSKWQQRSRYLSAAFTWTATRIYENHNQETWFFAARKWAKDSTGEQQANTLAGLHADYVMFIIDEAGGVPDAVLAAAEAALSTGVECKILIAGNPTHLTGPLYRACKSTATKWHVIEITGDPDNPKRSKRISIEWARQQIREWGRDNPWVLVNVFGQFPPSSINALLGPEDVERAMKRILPPESYKHAAKILGVDVALQGDDRTVIAPRQGLVAFKPKILRVPDPAIIAQAVAQSAQRWGADAINVDNTGGYGSGVISYLEGWGFAVNPVQFAGKAMNPVYGNKRAEMGWELAKWVLAGGCLPNIPELAEEACAIEYTHKRDCLMLVEKSQVKETLGRSPDLWDAYALTFAYPVAKADPLEPYRKKAEDFDYMVENYGGNKQQVDEYNPFM